MAESHNKHKIPVTVFALYPLYASSAARILNFYHRWVLLIPFCKIKSFMGVYGALKELPRITQQKYVLYYAFRLSMSSRKRGRFIIVMPCSLRRSSMPLEPSMIIFLKESSIMRSGRSSVSRFCSSGMA